ncbi:DNA methyltransferase [Brevundimonas vesicularis]|uniref:DNA methyltransferase n=1 Tax=Brevundimonas vesicularis TaxID=41276 RepID=UPI002F2B8E3F
MFDPACGCGNFLIIAYRELRALEIEVLKALYPTGQRDLEATALSKVDVDQFYGVEIDEFPARIAETAMWMMDHIMNNRLSLEFGQAILDARDAHPGTILADLYDPDVMPADLRRAHRALDQAVDRLYRRAPFDSDRERVEHLFALYEKMTAGLLAAPSKLKRRKKADA